MKPRNHHTAVDQYLRRKGITSWADVQALDPDDRHQHRHLAAVIAGLFPDWRPANPDQAEALYQTLHRLRDTHQTHQTGRNSGRC